ncbi:hypothetical protein [Pseudomonas sp. NPDC089547]|uniref:hypothetical protein n=1 Tax=Pseudomonas sp. NPDC089547 TaxID=3390652 RepID=UPI003D087987
MTISDLAVFFVFSTFALDVAARGHDLSFDDDGEKVIIRVKVPSGLAAREVQAIYRSTLCAFVAYGVNGDPYRRDSYRHLAI